MSVLLKTRLRFKSRIAQQLNKHIICGKSSKLTTGGQHRNTDSVLFSIHQNSKISVLKFTYSHKFLNGTISFSFHAPFKAQLSVVVNLLIAQNTMRWKNNCWKEPN